MLKLTLPKGSLGEQTLQLFAQADLEVMKGAREYTSTIDDPRIEKVKILRPQEIPTYIAEGYFDLGISGADCVQECGADVVKVAELPYAKTGAGTIKMVIAVSNTESIAKPEEIRPGSRVTTEFPNVTKAYFDKLGIPVKIFYSYGASEAKIPELMDVVVDLTETGATLSRNQLKVIGVIGEFPTLLIANKDAWNDPDKKKAIEEIKTLLLGVIEARGRVLLSMNVAKKNLDSVLKALPAMKRPTVSSLADEDYVEVTTVVDKKGVNILLPRLKGAGAEDILEMPISKIVK
ncbi:MAG: ATP phosphoribosyltransferase [Actinomycetota bacterium]